jgi:hypothetical protein
VLIRIIQLEKTEHGDRTRAAAFRFEVWADMINAQMEIGRILKRAEAIIGHNVEGSIPVIQNPGKALHRLFVQERHRLTIDWVSSQLLTGRWTLCKGRGRENGPTFQLISSARSERAEREDKQT